MALLTRERDREGLGEGKDSGIYTYLGNNLHLLPMTILTLRHRRLQSPYDPLIQLTRTCNHQLHLPTVCAHQLSELLTNPLQQTQSIVLRKRLQEVLHRAGSIRLRSGVLFQLGDDGRFIRFSQGGGVEDGREFRVGF